MVLKLMPVGYSREMRCSTAKAVARELPLSLSFVPCLPQFPSTTDTQSCNTQLLLSLAALFLGHYQLQSWNYQPPPLGSVVHCAFTVFWKVLPLLFIAGRSYKCFPYGWQAMVSSLIFHDLSPGTWQVPPCSSFSFWALDIFMEQDYLLVSRISFSEESFPRFLPLRSRGSPFVWALPQPPAESGAERQVQEKRSPRNCQPSQCHCQRGKDKEVEMKWDSCFPS